MQNLNGAELILKYLRGQMTDSPPIPCKTELTVLSADDTKELKLAFIITEYNGCEISTPEGNIIKEDQELQIGQQIVCWGCLSTVESPGQARSNSGNSIWFLKRGGDDRKSWICCGSANRKALDKLQLSSKNE